MLEMAESEGCKDNKKDGVYVCVREVCEVQVMRAITRESGRKKRWKEGKE